MSVAKKKQPESISDQVREALKASGLVYHEIASKSGVDHAVISRFDRGRRTITLETLDRLAPVLKIRISRR